MPSHDTEEFGGELYHDIIARLERSWGLWRDALGQVPDDESQISRLAISLIDETMTGDDDAVELIRQLLEGDSAVARGERGFSAINPITGSLADARREMSRLHDRLLGAIEAASQASDDILEQVREQIGGVTWIRYEERAARLNTHLHDRLT